MPSYQTGVTMPDNVDTGSPGRGVPDVAGDADPETGYSIFVDGNQETVGGTSAVAPLWAGLIALINESLGQPVGFVQPRLYQASVRRRLSRHHAGQQRRLHGRAGLGSVHRAGEPGWWRAAHRARLARSAGALG